MGSPSRERTVGDLVATADELDNEHGEHIYPVLGGVFQVDGMTLVAARRIAFVYGDGSSEDGELVVILVGDEGAARPFRDSTNIPELSLWKRRSSIYPAVGR